VLDWRQDNTVKEWRVDPLGGPMRNVRRSGKRKAL
jgi:hypothetical protein